MKAKAPTIALAGISHQTAPVEEREALAFPPQELPQALARLRQELGAAVLLSTCNRTELYASLASAEEARRLVPLLLALRGAQVDPSRFYLLTGLEAVRHLYRVAAGLDSLVVGESQIQGQVREAFAAATDAGCVNGVLSRLFHTALAVGKRARRETAIGRWAASVGSAAVALAQRVLGGLEGRTVLVVSAGATGKLAARALAEAGAGRVLVTNRTYARALEVARALGGQPVPFSQLTEALAQADIVISATGAQGFVLGPQQVAAALPRRAGRPLVCIDIAVPRDIDPAVGGLEGVHLYDIDDLQAVAPPQGGHLRELRRAEAIVQEEAARFQEWWQSLDAVPVIAALRQQAEAIRRRELERTLRRLSGLSQQDRQRIEAMTAAIVNKLLHRPIARLKDGADLALYSEVLADLFGLPAEPPRP
jgi:glutamyl-tRNA reductase